MTAYSDGDSQYLRGRIDGYLLAAARHSADDTSFDRERWKELYGERVVYNSVPAYPSEEARDRDEDAVVLCDWEAATETKFLKPGVELPLDRSGSIVFANGTTVIVRSGTASMFTLANDETEYVERMDDLALEVLRETSGFYQQRST